MTLNEARLMLKQYNKGKSPDLRCGISIIDSGWKLIAENGVVVYQDLEVPAHNADGTVPVGGHPDIPDGEGPSEKNLFNLLDV